MATTPRIFACEADAAAAPRSTTARLALEGELTIYRAAELKARLLEPLQDAGAVSLDIDLSRVTELDSSGLQLLMLARRQALAQGGALRLVDHSPAVREVFDLLDLAGQFGDPPAMAPASA